MGCWSKSEKRQIFFTKFPTKSAKNPGKLRSTQVAPANQHAEKSVAQITQSARKRVINRENHQEFIFEGIEILSLVRQSKISGATTPSQSIPTVKSAALVTCIFGKLKELKR